MKLTGNKENYRKFLLKVDEIGYFVDEILPNNWTLYLNSSVKKLQELLNEYGLKFKQETVTTTDDVAIKIKTILQDTKLQVSASAITVLDSNNQIEYVLNWWQWQITCRLALIAECSSVFEGFQEIN